MSNQRNTKTLPLSANSSIQCKKKIANISDNLLNDNEENINTKSVICDEFLKELLKHDINTEKWYHNLLIGKYYEKITYCHFGCWPHGTSFILR